MSIGVIRNLGSVNSNKKYYIFNAENPVTFYATSALKGVQGAYTTGTQYRGVSLGKVSGGVGVCVYSPAIDFTKYSKLYISIVSATQGGDLKASYGYGTNFAWASAGWNDISIANGIKQYASAGLYLFDISNVTGERTIYLQGCGGNDTGTTVLVDEIWLEA